MKFKYMGKRYGCIDFVTAGILKPGEMLEPGKVYDIPDDDEMLILACKTNGAYVEVKNTEVKKTENQTKKMIKEIKKGDK